MPNITDKPKHLPDFLAPPLNEVVLGVQFSAPKGYQQILARDVWNLFRSDYPQVQEQQPLPPSFETVGLPHQHSYIPQISFATGASHDRFWFLRPDGDELIQFQQDRLLHNWRKVGDGTNEYRRFESMILLFRNELEQLQAYFETLAPQTLVINQCEISYINHIHIGGEESSVPGDWLSFVNFGTKNPDEFSMSFREVIRDDAGKFLGRLSCDTVSATLPSGQEIVAFTLTVRGAPQETSISSAIDFLTAGRNIIGQRFVELTTPAAHIKWKRLQ